MRHTILIIFAAMISIAAFSQKLEPFKDGKFVGLKSTDGKIVVAADKYNYIGNDFENYTWVNIGGKSKLKNYPIGGKWGVIDETGKEVCPPVYDYVAACHNDFVAVNVGGVMKNNTVVGGKWGIFDLKAGKEIIAPNYSSVSCVNDDGNLWVNVNGKMNYQIMGDTILNDKNKVEDCTPIFEFFTIYPMNLQICNVSNEGEWSLIDMKGNKLTTKGYNRVSDFANGYALVKSNGKFGYVDKKGCETVSTSYEKLSMSSNGRCCWAQKTAGSKVCLLDITSEKALTEAKYDSIGMKFQGAVAWVKLNNLYCLVDTTGKQLTEARYAKVGTFSHGISFVYNQKNTIGAVNTLGQEVVRTIYNKTPLFFGEGSQFKGTNGVYVSWFYHPMMGYMWVDQTGKVLIRNGRAQYSINDVIPEALWDY